MGEFVQGVLKSGGAGSPRALNMVLAGPGSQARTPHEHVKSHVCETCMHAVTAAAALCSSAVQAS